VLCDTRISMVSTSAAQRTDSRTVCTISSVAQQKADRVLLPGGKARGQPLEYRLYSLLAVCHLSPLDVVLLAELVDVRCPGSHPSMQRTITINAR
jgi:hypothetical protein